MNEILFSIVLHSDAMAAPKNLSSMQSAFDDVFVHIPPILSYPAKWISYQLSPKFCLVKLLHNTIYGTLTQALMTSMGIMNNDNNKEKWERSRRPLENVRWTFSKVHETHNAQNVSVCSLLARTEFSGCGIAYLLLVNN